MSYIVTIARFPDDADPGRTTPIMPGDWDRMVAADPTLEPEAPRDATGQSVRWTADPDHPQAVFFYQPDGDIDLYNLNEPAARKVMEIASLLGARVRGEEGEFYDEVSTAPHSKRSGCLSLGVRSLLALVALHRLHAA